MFKSSSPPPLFSSDDSGETLDITNYESPRFSKPKRKGAWYETEYGESTQTTPEAKKAKMERKYDSGVYLLSDASDASMDPPIEHKSPFSCMADAADEDEVETTEAAFLHALRSGLDADCQRYDFSSLSLGDEDIKSIGELNSIIKNVPDAGNDLPVEGQYRSLVPEIYINLGRNVLRRLTPSLFDLQHLTTLVLRDNAITELPPHISRLRNLKELDVTLNRLKCLPYELLEMLTPKGKLQRLITLGNYLIDRMPQSRYQNLAALATASPSTDVWKHLQAVSPDHEALAWYYRYTESRARTVGGWRNMENIFTHRYSTLFHEAGKRYPLHYIAHTLPSFFDQAGRLLRGSPAQPQSTMDTYDCIVNTQIGAFGAPNTVLAPPTTTHVSSLLTLSVNTALANISVEETRDKLGDYAEQPDVAAILTKAQENDDGGFGYFRQCHACKRDYVVARAEWIEFWSICTVSPTFYPFKARVCSWGCVPTQMRRRPAKELAW